MAEPPFLPCPGCGFLVHERPAGADRACRICNWLDDDQQGADPLLADGANPLNLIEHQRTVLIHLPPEVRRQGTWERDPRWRPATPADAAGERSSPVCLLGGEPERERYYWRR